MWKLLKCDGRFLIYCQIENHIEMLPIKCWVPLLTARIMRTAFRLFLIENKSCQFATQPDTSWSLIPACPSLPSSLTLYLLFSHSFFGYFCPNCKLLPRPFVECPFFFVGQPAKGVGFLLLPILLHFSVLCGAFFYDRRRWKNPVWSYFWPWSNGDEHPPAFGRVLFAFYNNQTKSTYK